MIVSGDDPEGQDPTIAEHFVVIRAQESSVGLSITESPDVLKPTLQRIADNSNGKLKKRIAEYIFIEIRTAN
jgi:hypothetical protein